MPLGLGQWVATMHSREGKTNGAACRGRGRWLLEPGGVLHVSFSCCDLRSKSLGKGRMWWYQSRNQNGPTQAPAPLDSMPCWRHESEEYRKQVCFGPSSPETTWAICMGKKGLMRPVNPLVLSICKIGTSLWNRAWPQTCRCCIQEFCKGYSKPESAVHNPHPRAAS